jgi:hypothetical protein
MGQHLDVTDIGCVLEQLDADIVPIDADFDGFPDVCSENPLAR